jgi:hypothetical protein
MKSRLLLDIVIAKSATIFKLLASEEQPLLIRRDSLLILNLGLNAIDGGRKLDIKGDGLPSQRLHKNLNR